MIGAVLADDLTGAFDVAEHAVDLAPSIRVFAAADDPVHRHGLVVLSTGTRHLTADTAAGIVRATADRLAAAGVPLLFAKFDSTLRGNIRAELAALTTGRPGFVFCPANPPLGRTVVGGRLLVDGVPVEATVYARDPKFPAAADRPPSADARDAADLARLAGEAAERGALPAGSSAFFRAVAKRLAGPRPVAVARRFACVPAGRTLYLNGSLNPVAADDEGPLLARGAAACRLDALPAETEGSLVVSTRALAGYRGLAPFARPLLALLARSRFDTVIVSGGETLAEFFRIAGTASAAVAASVAPGLPALDFAAAGVRFTLLPKPGGFPLRAPAPLAAAADERKDGRAWIP